MPWVKQKKPKKHRINKGTLKLYFSIILICFVVAWVLAFLLGKLPSFTRQLEADIIEEVVRETGKTMDADSLKKLKKNFDGKIDEAYIEKIKKSYRDAKNRKE